MNEFIRTLVFVAVGAVVALGAYFTKPRLAGPESAAGAPLDSPLFPEFKDPLLAKSLEIKQFDEATARIETFAVAQQADGHWSIPSHGGYPADAESQLRNVAELLADLKVIGVIDEKTNDPKSEQAHFGVLDPEKAEVGTSGVGTLISVEDSKGNDLLRLIVGKEVQGATNQRFVRKPNEDLIYVTSIDMSKLPTEFDKWIEKDLLKLSTFDVSRVVLKDYLMLPTQRNSLMQYHRMDAKLTYDSSKGEWKLEEPMQTYREGRSPQPQELGNFEEINKQKLDDLRNALGDLKIVDVAAKPAGLGNSLKVSSEKLPQDKWPSLWEYGFYPQPGAEGTLEIYGKNGEVLIDTKDGVEYILRFGEIAPQSAVSSSPKKPAAKGGKAAPEEEQVKVHRYLFVSTQLAPSILKEPEYEPEPAGPETPKTEPEKDKDKQAKAEPSADKDKDEEKPAVVDPQQAERERIKKENERKRNAYKDQRKKAELRVNELNARFADWYYVVSEDVYKKIRLTRADIVKESATAKDEGFGIDAFRKLEEEGPKGSTKIGMP
jgi:hypothetical protein